MSKYRKAVDSLKSVAREKQADLDFGATANRVDNWEAQKAAILAWEPADSPFRPVVDLLASTFTLGRDSDDYPQLGIPEVTANVLRIAFKAGMANHGIYSDGSGFSGHPDSEAWERDYAAWKTAHEYRIATKEVWEL